MTALSFFVSLPCSIFYVCYILYVLPSHMYELRNSATCVLKLLGSDFSCQWHIVFGFIGSKPWHAAWKLSSRLPAGTPEGIITLRTIFVGSVTYASVTYASDCRVSDWSSFPLFNTCVFVLWSLLCLGQSKYCVTTALVYFIPFISLVNCSVLVEQMPFYFVYEWSCTIKLCTFKQDWNPTPLSELHYKTVTMEKYIPKKLPLRK